MPRCIHKLVRNGNATSISIPRVMLYHLGWVPGESMMLEMQEDGKSVLVRRPNERDFGPVVSPYAFRNEGSGKP